MSAAAAGWLLALVSEMELGDGLVSRAALRRLRASGAAAAGKGGGGVHRGHTLVVHSRVRAYFAVVRAGVCVHVDEACVRGLEKRADIESRSWLHSVGDARGKLACGRSVARRMSRGMRGFSGRVRAGRGVFGKGGVRKMRSFSMVAKARTPKPFRFCLSLFRFLFQARFFPTFSHLFRAFFNTAFAAD